MSKMKFWIEALVGLLLASLIMWSRGVFTAKDAAAVVMAIGDGFTVVAVLYLGVGALMWVSTTGMFDVFGYAVKRGMRALIPGFYSEDADGRFYEYKVKQEEKRKKGFTQYSTLIWGMIFFAISIVLTAVWYAIA
jgi:hypothetical protein